MSFFGGLDLGQVAEREAVEGMTLYVASLLDLAGTKMAVVQKRAEVKDYLDVDALLRHGVGLPVALPLVFSTTCRAFPKRSESDSARQ